MKAWLDYLRQEHDRLAEAIGREQSRPQPDRVELARLRKLKLAVRDHLAEWERMAGAPAAA